MNLSAELKSWIRKQERNSDKTKRKRERGRMSKDKDRFPKDCWEKKCEHFRIWDMSIDEARERKDERLSLLKLWRKVKTT